MPATPAPSLTVVLPMWNEADGAEAAVAAVVVAGRELVERERLSSLVVQVVDDASTDATPEITDGLADQWAEVSVVHLEQNRGLGGAVRSGIDASKGDLVLYTDADLPVDMSQLARAVDEHDRTGAALVAAYRLDRRSDGPRRLVYSIVWNRLVRHLLRVDIRDVNFAFKLMDGDLVRSFALESTGGFIDAELVARISGAGGDIAQFGAVYQPRLTGRSSFTSLRAVREMLGDLIGMRHELRASPSGGQGAGGP